MGYSRSGGHPYHGSISYISSPSANKPFKPCICAICADQQLMISPAPEPKGKRYEHAYGATNENKDEDEDEDESGGKRSSGRYLKSGNFIIAPFFDNALAYSSPFKTGIHPFKYFSYCSHCRYIVYNVFRI